MTGKELVEYILNNDLGDKDIIKDNGFVIGFMKEDEAAALYGVGPGTIKAWVNMKMMKGVNMNGQICIPIGTPSPLENEKGEDKK